MRRGPLVTATAAMCNLKAHTGLLHQIALTASRRLGAQKKQFSLCKAEREHRVGPAKSFFFLFFCVYLPELLSTGATVVFATEDPIDEMDFDCMVSVQGWAL